MQPHSPQEFDNTLKALLGKEAKEILPLLLPHTEFTDDKNIEIDRTILKADLVHNILYRGRPHILNMELQTGSESKIDVRVLQYHIGLHAKHENPVISVIMYPFKTTIPKPPYREMSGDEAILTLHYRVLALWKLEAQRFVQHHAVCVYTLLPAMRGANAPMLIQALHEMQAYYTRQQFGHHLIRFRRIVQRSKTLSARDKQLVEEEIRMHMTYDWFIDDNPDVQEHIEKRANERAAAVKAEAKMLLQHLQKSVCKIISLRFPSLAAPAQKQIALIDNPDLLDNLVDQLLVLSDEVSVRKLLQLPLSSSANSMLEYINFM